MLTKCLDAGYRRVSLAERLKLLIFRSYPSAHLFDNPLGRWRVVDRNLFAVQPTPYLQAAIPWQLVVLQAELEMGLNHTAQPL